MKLPKINGGGGMSLFTKIVAVAALGLLAVFFVGCGDFFGWKLDESMGTPSLPSRVGYDELKLHGKYRQYVLDTDKGDNPNKYSTGLLDQTDVSLNLELKDMPSGAIKNVGGKYIETPTYWSRIPLSIMADNNDQRNGLFSVHAAGTSLLFPNNQNGLADRTENNMRQCTSGVYVAFLTNSSKIKIHYQYMTRSDQDSGGRKGSGFDVYEVVDGTPVFKKNLKSDSTALIGSLEFDCQNTDKQLKKFMIMLPTYNGFEHDSKDINAGKSGLTFEFDEGAKTFQTEVFNESKQKPILIYGTSITQGDGNNGLRPGACYAAQIMFATKREVINCGFAGSAQLEYKMADFLANIDAEVFVIDPGWNLTSSGANHNADRCSANGAPANITNQEVIDRTKYMIKTYRAKHPDTPIIVCPKFLSGCAASANSADGLTNVTSCMTNVAGWEQNFSNCQMSREGLLLYTAYLECKQDGIKKLYWACQDAKIGQTWNSDNTNYINCSDLHPCSRGMSSIANFILKCMKTNNLLNCDLIKSPPEGCATCTKGDHGNNWQ